MEVLAVVGCVLLVALLAALAAITSPECAVCGSPIYRTRTGWRHKPGYAPSDGHRAVPADRK